MSDLKLPAHIIVHKDFNFSTTITRNMVAVDKMVYWKEELYEYINPDRELEEAPKDEEGLVKADEQGRRSSLYTERNERVPPTLINLINPDWRLYKFIHTSNNGFDIAPVDGLVGDAYKNLLAVFEIKTLKLTWDKQQKINLKKFFALSYLKLDLGIPAYYIFQTLTKERYAVEVDVIWELLRNKPYELEPFRPNSTKRKLNDWGFNMNVGNFTSIEKAFINLDNKPNLCYS